MEGFTENGLLPAHWHVGSDQPLQARRRLRVEHTEQTAPIGEFQQFDRKGRFVVHRNPSSRRKTTHVFGRGKAESCVSCRGGRLKIAFEGPSFAPRSSSSSLGTQVSAIALPRSAVSNNAKPQRGAPKAITSSFPCGAKRRGPRPFHRLSSYDTRIPPPRRNAMNSKPVPNLAGIPEILKGLKSISPAVASPELPWVPVSVHSQP